MTMTAATNGVVIPSQPKRQRKARGAAVAPLVAAQRPTRKEMSARRRIALAVGGVGTFVLGLSVQHCTDALVMTTGCSWLMGGLMAIGIDCGMVACEAAATVAGKSARSWAKWYVGLSVVLSMLLNAIASAAHASHGYVWLSYGVGAIVPVLVFVLGAVASKLWTEG